MSMTKEIEEAKRLHQDAVEALDEQDSRIQALPDDTPDEERTFHLDVFAKREEDVNRRHEALERLIAINKARATLPAGEEPAEERKGQPATPKNSLREEPVYTPDSARRGHAFFADLVESAHSPECAERIHRHQKQMRAESRDISTTATAGGGFVPPAYLGELYAEKPRPGRPFADAIPKMPLMAKGMTITLPRITTGTAVAFQAGDNQSVQETNIVEATLTTYVETVAGQQDVSVQLLDRSDPAIDVVVFEDLRRAYDAKLDTACISGAGHGSTEHLGIRGVSSINTVAYTDGSPTAAEFFPKVYDAIQKVASNRYVNPDLIVMHPRRAAWLASNLSSTFPLVQQGGLMQAAGTQDGGFTQTIGGLRVISDANIVTTYSVGGNTDEDEVYVVASDDLILMEGALQARVLPDVGSGTLTTRLQLFAYSAFISGRQPASITKIAGSGLSAPSF